MNTYSPTEASKRAGVSASTVRKYAGEFPTFFSETATPHKGESRLFTDEDISVLVFIAQRRKNGATDELIESGLLNDDHLTILDEMKRGDQEQAALVEAVKDAGSIQLARERERVVMLERQIRELRSDAQSNQEMIQAERERFSNDLKALNDRLIEAREAAAVSKYQADEIERLRAEIEKLGIELKEERNKKRGWFGR